MYNLCYGMKVINFSQLPGGNKSHPNYALDLAGSDTGIDFWYAQGRWKCIKKIWKNYYTFLFCPVDPAGNYTKVHCADGVDRIVTIALTHSDSVSIRDAFGRILSTIKVGYIYENGAPMYQEGKDGNATGNHIHLEVAEGVQTSKYWDTSMKVYRMKNELNPLKVFFINKAFSTVKNLRGASVSYCNNVLYSKPTVYLNATHATFNIRSSAVNGDILTTVPKGKKAVILGYIPKAQSDGYEWLFIEYNGIKGYSRLDTLSINTLSSDGEYPGLKFYAKYKAVRLRSKPVNGSVLKTIKSGKWADIVSFVKGVSSDGYQWAYCLYDGKLGYCQIDTKDCYAIGE